MPWVREQDGGEGITILRAYTYNALHKSFFHRLLSFFSFMFSSFFIGLGVKPGGCGLGDLTADLSGSHRLAVGPAQAGHASSLRCATCGRSLLSLSVC